MPCYQIDILIFIGQLKGQAILSKKDSDFSSQWNCQEFSHANTNFSSDIYLNFQLKRKPKKKDTCLMFVHQSEMYICPCYDRALHCPHLFWWCWSCLIWFSMQYYVLIQLKWKKVNTIYSWWYDVEHSINIILSLVKINQNWSKVQM